MKWLNYAAAILHSHASPRRLRFCHPHVPNFAAKIRIFFLEQLNEKDYVDAVRTLVRNSNSSNNSAPQSESSCISIEQTQCVRLNDSFVERVTSANLELCPHALLDQADKCTRNYAYDAMSSSHNTNVKAAFIFLLTDLRFYEMYLGAVDLFNRHVLSYMPYPVVVFYLRTDKFPFDEHMKVIRQRTLSSVEFAEMQNWHAPAVAEENMKSSLWRGNTCANSTWPIDYILMCRFFMGPVFTQPVMAKYDYYLRLDADLHIVAPFPFDPFEVMAKRDMDLLYWNADHAEHEGCVHDIRKTAMEYAKNTMKLLPCQLRNLERLHPHASIGGMFTGGSLAFFRSADYQQLANYLIDAMNGVYMHRWCDQNIYPIAAALLSSPEKWLRMGWKQGSCFAHKRQRPISDGPYDGDLRSIFDYDDSMKI